MRNINLIIIFNVFELCTQFIIDLIIRKSKGDFIIIESNLRTMQRMEGEIHNYRKVCISLIKCLFLNSISFRVLILLLGIA